MGFLYHVFTNTILKWDNHKLVQRLLFACAALWNEHPVLFSLSVTRLTKHNRINKRLKRLVAYLKLLMCMKTKTKFYQIFYLISVIAYIHTKMKIWLFVSEIQAAKITCK